MCAIGRVTVGVSGSARNLSAVRYAAALARGHAAMLIPVLAWMPPGGEAADRRYPSPYLRREWDQAAWQRLHDAINLALGGMPSDLAAKPTVVLGHAGPALVRAAGGVGDLLVIGTGRRGIAGRLAGRKVSRYCLARASCPVLAVPPASGEPDGAGRLRRRERQPAPFTVRGADGATARR